MRSTKQLLTVLIVLLLFSCTDDDPPLIEPPIQEAQFSGEFSVDIEHISWVQTKYDNVGNIISQGYDTTNLQGASLFISSNNSDTFLLNAIINSFDQSTISVPAIQLDDTLRLIHEFGEPRLRNDYVRGDVWLNGDSLFYSYSWDRSDIWSTGALPERGIVTAKGVRQ